jgi:hypothetical protein
MAGNPAPKNRSRVDNALTSGRLVQAMAPLTLLLRLLPVSVFSVLLGCNSAGSLPRPVHTAPDLRLSEQEPALAPAATILDISGPSADAFAPAGNPPAEETLLDTQQTIVTVTPESLEESSHVLRFSLETRGSETLGIRVSFSAPGAEHDENTKLGLRAADRIEEVDGLPVAGFDALSRAWQDVGRRQEVRFLIRRGDRAHMIIYRQSAYARP